MDDGEVGFLYAQAALDNEFKTFDALDNKSHKFLSLVSLMIGVSITLLGWFFQKICPPETAGQCWIMFCLFVYSFCLFIAWYKLFKSIKISSVPTIMLDDKITNALIDSKTDNLKEIIETYSKLIKYHKEAMSGKVLLLESSYRWIIGASTSLLVLLYSVVVFFST